MLVTVGVQRYGVGIVCNGGSESARFPLDLPRYCTVLYVKKARTDHLHITVQPIPCLPLPCPSCPALLGTLPQIRFGKKMVMVRY